MNYRFFIFEGTDSAKMRGWKNVLTVDALRKTSVPSISPNPEALAFVTHGKFYAHGTWEGGDYDGESFPAPRSEIIAEMFATDFCAKEEFFCAEHRYNPPENSGFSFCPRCEIKEVA